MAQNTGWMKRNRKRLLLGGPLLLLLIVAVMYATGGRYISTDDAYMQAARVQISTNIPGRVVEIPVHDNQPVKQGDLLFKLDDRDYVIAVEDASAKLANAKLQIAAMKATYGQHVADVKNAQDTLAYQQREMERQAKLAKQGISSQSQLDLARHAYDSARQQVTMAEQQQANTRATLGDNPDIAVDEHPTVKQVQAMLDRAKLNLSYCEVVAPSDGIVTKVEQLQVGNYINAATPLFSLVSNQDIWVEANYKETELAHMKAGQPATIKLDSYPGREFHGKVDSTSPGTGSSFSLLPPENATGNWVKVVQRLPVRISIDAADHDVELHAGMSAIVTVDTGHSRIGGRE